MHDRPCRLPRILSGLGLAAFCGLMAVTWVALLLAGCGRFSAPVALLAGGMAFGVVLVIRLRTSRAEPSAPAWPTVAAVGVALGSLTLTAPPSEMILGGWDPGVYLHTASAVVQQKSLQFKYIDYEWISAAEGALVARNLHGIPEFFGGMRMLPEGRLTPQFYHAYPSLLAVAWSLGGVWAALYLNPVLAAGSLLALFALGRRLFGARWALAAMVWMALNPAQIWQAKFSTAEMLGQLFVLGALALWIPPAGASLRRRLEPFLAGCALGLALLTRYDTLLLAAPWILLLLIFWFDLDDRRAPLYFLAPLAALALHTAVHQWKVAPYYSPLDNLVKPCLLLGAGLVIPWVAVRLSPWGGRVHAWVVQRRSVLDTTLAALFAGWFLFAWFIRPEINSARLDARVLRKVMDILPASPLQDMVRGPEASNMLYLVSVLGPVGLLLAGIGVVWMLRRGGSLVFRSAFYAAVAVMMVLVTHVFHDHFMMWVARRYVPVVVPLLIVGGVGALACGAWRWPRWRLAAWGMWMAAIGLQAPAIRVTAQYRDWPGLVKWFEHFQRAIPDPALVYCDQPGFAAPLRFLYGKRSYELHFPKDWKYRELTGIMQEKTRRGLDVFYLTANPPLPELAEAFVPVGSFPLQSRVLNSTRRAVPQSTKPRGADFVLYRVVPARGSP